PPQVPPPSATNAPGEHATPPAAARMRTPDTAVMSKQVVESPHMLAVEPAEHPDAIPHANAIRHAHPRLLANSAPIAKLAAPADSTPNAKPTPHADPLTGAEVMNEQGATISGCLQSGDGSFRLTETSGANAPRSRSWKS